MDQLSKHPNAQRWTVESVTEHLLFIEKDAVTGDSLFLGKALAKRGLYRHIWSYWKRAFIDNEDMMAIMLNIETHFEAKLLEGALKKELSPSMAMMTLRYNYNWRDKNKPMVPEPLLKKYE